MKTGITLLTIFSLLLGTQAARASLNLTLRQAGSNHVTWNFDGDNDAYSFVTLGNDPYVYTQGFDRNLADGETVLSFEYKLTAEIPDFQLYFKAPTNTWSSTYSIRNIKLAATDQWTEFRLDIATQLSAWGVGARGDQLRFDFGGVAGRTVELRHIHICHTDNDPYVYQDNGIATFKKLIATGLPLLQITTQDGAFPTGEYVTPPVQGAVGTDIINNEYVNGRLRIFLDSETPAYDSGDYASGSSGMRIRLRGNSSAGSYAKPFKIKLERSADLLLRGDDDHWADNEWLLIRDEKMVDIAGYKLSELLGMDFVPQCRFVNVWFNDSYQGLYLLQDYVKRNDACRIRISDSGYLFEDDPYWWTADDFVQSSKHPTFNYTFRDPKLKDMSLDRRTYIEDYLSAYEQAVAKGGYDRYIDVPTLAAYALGHEILGTHDSAGANMYLTKFDDTDNSRIRVALMWDFDTSETYLTAWSNTKKDRLSAFYNNRDLSFNNTLVALWKRDGTRIINGMLQWLDEYADSPLLAGHDRSVTYDNTRWGQSNPSASQSIQRQRVFFPARKSWLNSHISEISTDGSGITEPTVTRQPVSVTYYNTMGQPSTRPHQGLNFVVTTYTDASRSTTKVLH